VRLRGYRDAKSQFSLPPDHATDVAITLAVAPEAPRAAPAPDATAPTSSGIRARTWITFAVGAGALGAGLGFELARAGAEDDARSAPTQVDAAESAATMEDRRTAARILAGVGGAAMVLGGVFLALDLAGSAPAARGASARARLGCRGAGCTVGLDGAF
jgi:hypothetical protein